MIEVVGVGGWCVVHDVPVETGRGPAFMRFGGEAEAVAWEVALVTAKAERVRRAAILCLWCRFGGASGNLIFVREWSARAVGVAAFLAEVAEKGEWTMCVSPAFKPFPVELCRGVERCLWQVYQGRGVGAGHGRREAVPLQAFSRVCMEDCLNGLEEVTSIIVSLDYCLFERVRFHTI